MPKGIKNEVIIGAAGVIFSGLNPLWQAVLPFTNYITCISFDAIFECQCINIWHLIDFCTSANTIASRKIIFFPIRFFSFGFTSTDEWSSLVPLTQCCAVRASTLQTLLSYHTNAQSLGDALRQAMDTAANRMTSSVLTDKHYSAIDRRLKIVLDAVSQCLQRKPIDSVVIDQ